MQILKELSREVKPLDYIKAIAFLALVYWTFTVLGCVKVMVEG